MRVDPRESRARPGELSQARDYRPKSVCSPTTPRWQVATPASLTSRLQHSPSDSTLTAPRMRGRPDYLSSTSSISATHGVSAISVPACTPCSSKSVAFCTTLGGLRDWRHELGGLSTDGGRRNFKRPRAFWPSGRPTRAGPEGLEPAELAPGLLPLPDSAGTRRFRWSSCAPISGLTLSSST